MYWATCTNEVHAGKTRRLPSQVNAQENKMSLIHEAIMEILRPLADGGSSRLEVE